MMNWCRKEKTQKRPKASSGMLVHPFYLLILQMYYCTTSFLESGLKAEIFKKQKQILKNYKCLLSITKSLTTVILFELLLGKPNSIHLDRKM